MLLHRHPLSSKRDENGSVKIEPAGNTVTNETLTAPRQKNTTSLTVPTIDLSTEPDLSDQHLYSWWRREKEAFQDAVMPDTESGGKIAQVAVC